jgi:hypothetical protein
MPVCKDCENEITDDFTEADWDQAGQLAREDLERDIEGAAFQALFDLLKTTVGDSLDAQEDEVNELVFTMAEGRLWAACWERAIVQVAHSKKPTGGTGGPSEVSVN